MRKLWAGLMKDKRVLVGILILPVFWACMFISMWWEDHEFDRMSPARHFELAENLISFDEAWKHLDAIPPNAPEAAKVPELREQLKAKQAAKIHAATVAANDAAERATNRAAALIELEKNLRNKGYDLTVSGSEMPDEVVITSSDFADTDHRVQFLAAMRSKHSGPPCWAGFRTVRLRSSSIPLVGFSESYSMECMN
jgi:hypothetical protein